jgi:hypothetical protein
VCLLKPHAPSQQRGHAHSHEQGEHTRAPPRVARTRPHSARHRAATSDLASVADGALPDDAARETPQGQECLHSLNPKPYGKPRGAWRAAAPHVAATRGWASVSAILGLEHQFCQGKRATRHSSRAQAARLPPGARLTGYTRVNEQEAGRTAHGDVRRVLRRWARAACAPPAPPARVRAPGAQTAGCSPQPPRRGTSEFS